jgi:hypothetical protein
MRFYVRPALAGILVLSLVSLNGCIAGLTYTLPVISTGTPATSIYTIDESNNKIDKFSLSASATAAIPSVTLSVPSGGGNITSVATDSTGQVYMGYDVSDVQSIAVFPAGATSSTAPSRTFTTSFTDVGPASLFVDAQGLVYVAVDSATVAVFAANATGAATPLRTINGGQTDINAARSITADASGNIYVATAARPGQVLVFSSTANNNVAPSRVITASSSRINYFGVAVDASGDIFVSENSRVGGSTQPIDEYAPGATDPATPIKTISGSPVVEFAGLRMDAAGNLYAGTFANPSALVGFTSAA